MIIYTKEFIDLVDMLDNECNFVVCSSIMIRLWDVM